MYLCLGDVQLPEGGYRSRCMYHFVAVVMNLWNLREKKKKSNKIQNVFIPLRPMGFTHTLGIFPVSVTDFMVYPD